MGKVMKVPIRSLGKKIEENNELNMLVAFHALLIQEEFWNNVNWCNSLEIYKCHITIQI